MGPRATITCPNCGAAATETMPADQCVYFYECTACRAVLRPKYGDCCVFCSYADRPCPPKASGACCP
ncbi:MAG: GDCCVxC domain-containing (seleno)protein [Vicinamibacteraceae bacterium]